MNFRFFLSQRACILAAACGLLFAPPALHAQTPAVTKESTAPAAREIKDLVKSVEKELGKLRSGNKKQDAAMDLSKTLTSTEVDKIATLKFKVGAMTPWHFPGPNITGWRVEATNEKFREGGVMLDVTLFAYFREDPTGMVAKLKKGQDIIVTGKLTRCDITALQSFVLHVDMGDSKLDSEKK